jgi:hypothetical protein
MSFPVTAQANEKNGARRGSSLQSDGTGPGYGILAGPAEVVVTGAAGNSFKMTAEQGSERVEWENSAHGNYLRLGNGGFYMEVLGGKDEGGLTITAGSDGFRVNGVLLASEKLVDWLDAFSTNLVMGRKPGSPEPMFPAAKTDFESKESASINSDGMRTQQ